MNAHLARVLAVLSVALVACLPPSGPAISSDEPEEPGRLEAFAVDPFQEPIGHSLVLGDAKPKIEARFGEPQALETWQADDRTSTAKLNFYRFTYPGLNFVIGEADDRSRSWIDSIELSDGHPPLKYGLGIGVDADAVAAAFAPAESVRRAGDLRLEAMAYEELNNRSVESYVELAFTLDEAGVVQKILIETIAL